MVQFRAQSTRNQVFCSGGKGLVALCLAVATFLGEASLGANANERVISDPTFQLALFGYDPVSYYADGLARQGSEDFEILYERLVWRFANEGNMLAFLDGPSQFMPAYGGHGAYAVSQGLARVGHPEVWERLGSRVFFFHDAAARYAFLLEAERLMRSADVNWPSIEQDLSP